MDKLGEVSKHEAYNRALKHPQIRSQESKELLFDYMFCQTFKRLEHVIINHLTKRRENLENDLESAQPDPAIVAQYKDIIREQDEKIRERDVRISDLTEANLFLQEEVKNAKQQIEDLTNAVETLKDMNSVLKSSQQIMSDGVPDQRQPQQDPSETSSSSREKSLERELKIRDDIIHELEMRLATIPNSVGEEDEQPQPQSRIETEMLNSQVFWNAFLLFYSAYLYLVALPSGTGAADCLGQEGRRVGTVRKRSDDAKVRGGGLAHPPGGPVKHHRDIREKIREDRRGLAQQVVCNQQMHFVAKERPQVFVLSVLRSLFFNI